MNTSLKNIMEECRDVLSYLSDDGFVIDIVPDIPGGNKYRIDIQIHSSPKCFSYSVIKNYIKELKNHMSDYGFNEFQESKNYSIQKLAYTFKGYIVDCEDVRSTHITGIDIENNGEEVMLASICISFFKDIHFTKMSFPNLMEVV
jgi:hypothetical protein